MIAQHTARIGGTEQPALLQDRNHLGAEHVQHRRQQRRHDVKAVRRAIGEPVLNEIGHLLRCAREGEVAPRAGEVRQQLPQGRLLAPHQAQDDLGAAARCLHRSRVREIVRRERPVERQM